VGFYKRKKYERKNRPSKNGDVTVIGRGVGQYRNGWENDGPRKLRVILLSPAEEGVRGTKNTRELFLTSSLKKKRG